MRADPAAVAEGLVAEALASDDVTSAAGALAFVEERLSELAALLPSDLRAGGGAGGGVGGAASGTGLTSSALSTGGLARQAADRLQC